MKLAGARWVTIAVNTAILLSALLVVHLLFVGGIDLRFGEFVPSVGKAKLTCNKIRNPFIILLVLLLLKPIVVRPAPLRRLRGWFIANRRTIVLSMLIAAAAAAPRFLNLGAHSLNPDALTWLDRSQRTVYALREGDYAKATAHLGHPGVVPAVLIGSSYIYLGEGTSKLSYGPLDPVTAARLPIAAVGTATCILLYLIGRRSLGDAAAFWGAAFLSLYPPHIAISRVVHIDSTLALFFMCSILCYLVAAEERSAGWMAASAVSFGLALLTKSPALLIPPVLLFWKACVALRDRRGPILLLETRDLAWLGAGFGIYFILFTRLWLPPDQSRWAAFSSYLPHADQAIAAVRAVAAFPPAAIAAALFAAGILCASLRRRAELRGRGMAPARLARALFLLLACLAFIRIFGTPIQNQILLMGKTYHIEELGHLKYWMGRAVSHPPRVFYLFMICVQTPPVMLLCTLAGAAVAVAAYALRVGRWRAILLCLAVPVVFIGVMSIGKKMGMRYISPSFPFLSLLAGVAIARAAEGAGVLFFPGGGRGARIAAHAAAGALVAGALAVPLARVSPYYDIYFNSFAGGPAGASRMILVGTWIGSKESAAILKPLVKDDDALYVASVHGEFRYHWTHDPPHVPFRTLVNRTRLPHVDWVVFPMAEKLRGLDLAALHLLDRVRPVRTLSKCGIDALEIFRMDDPPAREGRAYEAEDLKTGSGTQAVDNDASGGMAVRGTGKGALLYGPWERYAPGAWRAVFRVKERGEGNAATRFSVAGISKGEVFGSGESRPGDSAAADAYRDFTVDFTLKEPRRIQFCVDRPGPGDVWVDRVTVERR